MKVYLEKAKNILLYAGLNRTEYKQIKKDLTRLNQLTLKVLSLLTAIYMLIMLTVSSHNDIAEANRSYFIICLCITSIIFILGALGLFQSRVATMLGVYLYLACIFSYGIAIGATQESQTSVSFLIFIMVGPLIFYDRSIHLNCFVWVFNIIFIISSYKIKTPNASETDMINALSYGLISCVLNTWSMLIKVNRLWLEKKVQIMAETDGLTNLKNRNCFENNYKDELKQARRTVACIYIDVNGLHQLNNTKGHEAGDQMLKYLADEIVHLFGSEFAYRIGGDEYIVFCLDNNPEIIKKKVKELSYRMERKKYSISTGLVISPVKGLKPDELIKSADALMYQAKKEYYDQIGYTQRSLKE